jgi:class 3 adenylate cyclase
MKRILKKILKTPPYIPLEELRFYKLVRVIIGLAWFAHFYSLGLFFSLGIKELFYLQFLSISIFTFAFYLNEKKHYFTSISIGICEVIAHQIIVVIFIGSDSGFQYFLLLSAMVPFLLPTGKILVKSLILLSSLIGFLIINFIIGENTPIYILRSEVTFWLEFTNIFITFLFFGIWGMYLTIAMKDTEDELNLEREKSDSLLHNMLPKHVASELKTTGKSEPKRFESMTILFTDFKGFTELVASIPAITLVKELNDIFSQFDDIMTEEGVEKIQTVGDAYLAACGVPQVDPDHAYKCVKAAKRMIEFLDTRNAQHQIQWEMRVGIHSGPIVAGVVGKKKLTFNLFGDTINTASRFETTSEPGKINVSFSTYEKIKGRFDCEYRGKIMAKGKGELDMYFVK